VDAEPLGKNEDKILPLKGTIEEALLAIAEG